MEFKIREREIFPRVFLEFKQTASRSYLYIVISKVCFAYKKLKDLWISETEGNNLEQMVCG